MVKAILIKPLDGKAEGEPAEFSKPDFDMLERLGAVRAAPDDAGAPTFTLPEIKPEEAEVLNTRDFANPVPPPVDVDEPAAQDIAAEPAPTAKRKPKRAGNAQDGTAS